VARPSSRNLILDAAQAVVLRAGASHLTLDAVAQEAEVSKGGVLYHFPTKEVLLEGMVARLLERSRQRREKTLQQLPSGPLRELKADITTILAIRDSDDGRVRAALLAAVANEPKLMSTVREHNRKRFDAYERYGAQYERAAVLLLAAYGIFFWNCCRFRRSMMLTENR